MRDPTAKCLEGGARLRVQRQRERETECAVSAVGGLVRTLRRI